MNEPINKQLYEKVKKMADDKYKTHGAYKSAYIVKTYKELGGKYKGKKNDNEGLNRWFNEEWKDYAGLKYPVYRPTKRITKDTPLTVKEISKDNLKKQAKRKQKITNKKNLQKFKPK